MAETDLSSTTASDRGGERLLAYLAIIPDELLPKGCNRGDIRFGNAAVMHGSNGQFHIYASANSFSPLDFERVIPVEIRALSAPSIPAPMNEGRKPLDWDELDNQFGLFQRDNAFSEISLQAVKAFIVQLREWGYGRPRGNNLED